MKVFISAAEFDVLGAVEIDALPDTAPPPVTRRVTRVATLDGGVVVTDRGFSHGDKDITIRWRTVSKAQLDTVDRIFRLHSQVYVSTPEGVFLAAPETFTPDAGESAANFLAIEKVA